MPSNSETDASTLGPQYDPTGDIGVYSVAKIITGTLRWAFRQLVPSDTGIDAQVEIIRRKKATGRYLSLQIKSGKSYFLEPTPQGFVYRGESKHLEYWVNNALPVILVLFDPVADTAYWVHVSEGATERTKKAWKILVPKQHTLDLAAATALEAISQTKEQTEHGRAGRLLVSVYDRTREIRGGERAAAMVADPSLAKEIEEQARVAQLVLPPPKAVIARLIDQQVLSTSRDRRFAAVLGDYQLMSLRARGGMGYVFEAYVEPLERIVALKILRLRYARRNDVVQAFRQEARIPARIRCANVITVYGLGVHEMTDYIEMEYIEGPTLAQTLSASSVPQMLTLSTFRQLLTALSAVHDEGYIHCDIKTSNILFDETLSAATLIDFGLAIPCDENRKRGEFRRKAGTPQYMSPEQVEGDPSIDQRADLYSAGVVLYEMLTGRRPFDEPTVEATRDRLLRDEPEHPLSLESEADPVLADIAFRLLSKAPEDRYDSAKQVLDAVDTEFPPGFGRARGQLGQS